MKLYYIMFRWLAKSLLYKLMVAKPLEASSGTQRTYEKLPCKAEYIGLAVSEIFCYKQTDILLLYYKDK